LALGTLASSVLKVWLRPCIAQSGLKLYDFNIVDGELKRTQNVVVPGSEAADGMWQKKNMLTMNQTTGKAIIQLALHYVLFI